jgi:hypothetical protein
VVGTADGLFVRNWVGHRTIPRSDIDGFRVLTPSIGMAFRQNSTRGPTIHTIGRDGSMFPLHATGQKFADEPIPANLRRLEDWLQSDA